MARKKTYLQRMQDSQARRCPVCGKFFMAVAQREHHEANAARLCVTSKPDTWHRLHTS